MKRLIFLNIFLFVFIFDLGNATVIRVKRGYGYGGSSYRSQNNNNYNQFENYNNGYSQQFNLGGYGWNHGSTDPSHGQGIYSGYSNYYQNYYPQQNGYKSYGVQTNAYQQSNGYGLQYPNQLGQFGFNNQPRFPTGFPNQQPSIVAPPSINPGFAADLKPETKPLPVPSPPPSNSLPNLPPNIPVIQGTQTLIPDPTPPPSQENIPPIGGFPGGWLPPIGGLNPTAAVQKPPENSDSCFAGGSCRVPQLETTVFSPTLQPNMPDLSLAGSNQPNSAIGSIPAPFPDITPAVNPGFQRIESKPVLFPDITPAPGIGPVIDATSSPFSPDLAPVQNSGAPASPPPLFPDVTPGPSGGSIIEATTNPASNFIGSESGSIIESTSANPDSNLPPTDSIVTSPTVFVNPSIPNGNMPPIPPTLITETSWSDSQDDSMKRGLAIMPK